ncbi:two pore domain potassium channel family protein [Candidatus Woesearchaeota archaeon]|nr:two pore domain potassium channel family protein [Candidatus Woesearchaeota archaeon]
MKKTFLSLQDAFKEMSKKRKFSLNHIDFYRNFLSKKRLFSLERVDFYQILLTWFFLIFMLGVIYYFFSGIFGANLVSTITGEPITKITDTIYFSFITATSTGFGDIIPLGFFKIIAVLEVTLGLLLLAVVTSKLVSIKQDIILEELYEMSFTEKINRLRSSLLLFRQHASRIATHVDTGTVDKREIYDLYVYIHSLETVLEEMLPMVNPEEKHIFSKVIDPLDSELLINSILQSFERLSELVAALSKSSLQWKRPVTIATIKRCVSLNRQLFSKVIVSQKKMPGINETIADNERIVKEIEKLVSE